PSWTSTPSMSVSHELMVRSASCGMASDLRVGLAGRGDRGRATAGEPAASDLDDHGKHADQDDQHEDRLDVVVHEVELAEEVPQHGDADAPEQRADHVEAHEVPVGHPADARG